MRPLILYFNELSIPPEETQQQMGSGWKSNALMLFSGLQQVSRQQSKVIIAFPLEYWHKLYGAKPFAVWVSEWLGRDRYRWLLSKLRQDYPAGNEISDVYFENKKTVGITLARLAGSWAFGFPMDNSPWHSPSLTATEWYLDGNDVAHHACTVMHIANEAHATHWQYELYDWGKLLANENIIDKLGSYPIQMYPLDHGYPHVHLIDPQSLKTLAKYRVDCFERLEGLPDWDKSMYSWIATHQAQLLRSWARCQRGGHPYQITKP
jgi:hypothetical protein